MSDDDVASLLLGRSRIRQSILAILLDQPERRLHLRGLARAVGASAGTTAREVTRLERAGLVTRTHEGRQVYYQAAPDHPLFGPVQSFVRRTVGAPAIVRRALADVPRVEQVLIFGSYARGETRADSDVDLLVIGSPDRDDLTDRLEAAGREIGRAVNETVMSRKELQARRQRGDRFVESIDAGRTIAVLP